VFLTPLGSVIAGLGLSLGLLLMVTVLLRLLLLSQFMWLLERG